MSSSVFKRISFAIFTYVAAFLSVAVPAFGHVTAETPLIDYTASRDNGGACRIDIDVTVTSDGSVNPDTFRLALRYTDADSNIEQILSTEFNATDTNPNLYEHRFNMNSDGTPRLPVAGETVTIDLLERGNGEGENLAVRSSLLLTHENIAAIGDSNYCAVFADAIQGSGGANTAPVANAGPDQEPNVPEGANIVLDGSGSTDADGDALTYTWTEASGAVGPLMGVSPSFPAPAGDIVYTFSLVVNDGTENSADTNDGSATDSVVVITNSPPIGNSPPVADAGEDTDYTLAAGEEITLDGSGSTDVDGNALTYTWTETTGSGLVLMGVSPTFAVPDTDIAYTFDLVVNDGTVDSEVDSVNITNTVNAVPVADAGPDQTINAPPGTLITLDASASSDADGDPLTYNWKQLVEPGDPEVILSDTNAVMPTFAAPSADAVLTFRVIVNDGKVGSPRDLVQIFYSASAGNVAPVANAGPDQTPNVPEGTNIVLDGSGSTDADGDALTYTWTEASGAVGPLMGVSPSFPAPAGDIVYTFSLVVNDGTENSADTNDGSATDSVVVITNSPPVANDPPVSNAGPNQTLTATTGTIINLDGSASDDPDDSPSPLTYSWSQVSGTDVVLTGADTATPSFPAPNVTGDLVFRLVVSDGQDSDGDNVRIIFTHENTPPTADAGPDQAPNVSPGVAIALDGTGSFDPDGDPLNYVWTQTGGTPVTLSDSNAASPTFPAPAADSVLVFSLVVNDGAAISSPADEVTITYTALAGPAAPIANAGPDQTLTVAVGSTITLDGSASFDPNGDTITYAWTQTGGAAVTLSDATSPTPTFPAPTDSDSLVFSLVVNDGALDSPPDEVTINYTAIPPNNVPVADAGPDQAVTAPAGTVVTLDGTGSSDADGDPLTYMWTQTAGIIVSLSDPSAVSPTFTVPDSASNLVFSLVVSDGTDSSPADSVTIAYALPNTRPVADGGPDQEITALAGTTITLNGTASSDADGDPLTYLWEAANENAEGVSLSDPTSATPTFAAPEASGNYAFRLVVNDGTEDSGGDRTVVRFTVIAPNAAPIADAGPDQTVENAPEATITLDGSGSTDPEDDALTYMWTQSSGPAVTLSDATAVSPTFAAPADDATLEFSLVVNDGEFDSPADTVSIVFEANQVPVAAAAVPQVSANAGTEVTLDGSTSSDEEGAELTYMWTQTSGPDVTLTDADKAIATFTAPNVDEDTVLTFELVVNDGTSSSEPAIVTVTIEPTGSITIQMLTAGGDGSFDFASNLDALDATLTTASGTGQLTANDVGAGSYTVTLADPASDGFALDSLSCSGSNATGNIQSRQSSIVLAAGEDVTCTYSAVNSRNIASQQIKKMMVQRGTLLLGNQPNLNRRKQRLDGGSSSGNVQVAGFAVPGSSKMPFTANFNGQGGLYASTSLSQISGGKTNSGKGSIDIWGEATLANIDTAEDDGKFSILYGGADFMVTENILIGVLGQYDSFKSNNRVNADVEIDGDGYMVGPYMTARILDGVYLDGRVAWGKSDNSISPLGTFVDEFDTNRFLINGSLSGEKSLSEKVTFVPTLSLRHLTETQDFYVDSLGVAIPEQDIKLTELSFAPRIEYSTLLDKSWHLSSFGSVEGIFSGGEDYLALTNDRFRARLEGGASVRNSENGLRFGVSVFADGVGADGFSSEGVKFQIGWSPSRQ